MRRQGLVIVGILGAVFGSFIGNGQIIVHIPIQVVILLALGFLLGGQVIRNGILTEEGFDGLWLFVRQTPLALGIGLLLGLVSNLFF